LSLSLIPVAFPPTLRILALEIFSRLSVHKKIKTMRKTITLLLCSLFWMSANSFNAFAAPTAESTLSGDSNCDGEVNVMDVITTINYILGNNPQPFCFENADVNLDGIVNVIDVIGTVNIIMSGNFIPLCEALDNCELEFTTGGDEAWFGQTEVSYFGGDAAQSGAITHNQVSWMQTVVEGPGLLSFWWKVSSEGSYDFLRFYINDLQKNLISGNIDWQLREYFIPEGTHTLKWAYTKDGSVSQGQDCGWVDNLIFTVVDPPSVVTAEITDINSTTATGGGNVTDDGGFDVSARGVVWSTSENPSLESNEGFTVDGSGTGAFTSYLTGLSANSMYFVRAYATNEVGTAYGNQVSFTTTAAGLPVISEVALRYIGTFSAGSKALIESDGGSPVSQRGAVWSTIPNPTIENNQGISYDGQGTSLFNSNLYDLMMDTTYYLKAYATNANGTIYSEELSLMTTKGFTDIDGNFYESVKIGAQEWTAENLKTTHYSNGTPIEYPGTDENAWQNNTTGAYAWYENDIIWKDSYGALYNWHAVNNTNGLCPAGWHVPSDAEWTQLLDYVVGQGFPNNQNDPNGAGNALKSCRQVNSPLGGDCNTTAHPRWNSHSTHHGFDEFGFSALPGGARSFGYFFTVGYSGYWWSSTEFLSSSAWDRYLLYTSGSVYRYETNKKVGYSVRCLRD